MNTKFIFRVWWFGLIALSFSCTHFKRSSQVTERNALTERQRESIKQTFLDHQEDILACQKKAKQSQRKNGTLVLDFDLNSQGRVSRLEIAIEKSTLRDEHIEACLRERLKEWHFPIFEKEKLRHIFYPLMFYNS